MENRANVEDLEVLGRFRAYLVKVAESLDLALADVEGEINHTLLWLETEQLTHWTGQIRKRQEVLAAAKQALRGKQVYKTAHTSQPSTVDEQQAVQTAQIRLQDAEEKLAHTKKWIRQLAREILLYRGGVAPLGATMADGIPAALAQLGGAINKLEQYLAVPVDASSEPAVPPGQAPGHAGRSVMAQPPPEASVPPQTLPGAALCQTLPAAKQKNSPDGKTLVDEAVPRGADDGQLG